MAIELNDRVKLIGGVLLLAVAVILVVRSLMPSSPVPKARPVAGLADVSPAAPSRPRPVPGARGARRRYDATAPPANSDPKLRLDLLAKVAAINYEGSERNIFQYQAAPPPKVPSALGNPVTGPAAKKPDGPPPPAPPPPIPLKYYGYAHKPNDPVKRAFFIEGEEIHIAGEGEVIRKRYRVVKIGVNTVEVEDLVTKSRQTLPLQES